MLLQPSLNQMGLPEPGDLFSHQNMEHALLTCDEETWTNILKHSMMTGNDSVSTGSAKLDELEKALTEGADFHDLIKQLQ